MSIIDQMLYKHIRVVVACHDNKPHKSDVMERAKRVLMVLLGMALPAAFPMTFALATPPEADEVKDHPGPEPTVTRGMPDLVRYWNFDPPTSPLFDISRVTISGDIRVRPELRVNPNFGLNTANGQLTPGRAAGGDTADQFVQNWMRLGLNYAISPDVDTFFQLQYAKNWGGQSNPTLGNPANDPNTISNVGVRQAYLLIRNLGVEGLNLKAGRQLISMGNQRLFGPFDWNNIGFSFDGATLQYSQKLYEVWGGWVRLADTEAFNNGATSGAVSGGGPGNRDADLVFARLVFKPMASLSLEPLWVFLNNKQASNGGPTSASITAPHANNQNRHTLGGRAALRQGMFDGTVESYWQTGSMGLAQSDNRLHINAFALAAEGGVTLEDVPWTPRLGAEFNYASGDGSKANCNANTGAGCGGTANTFENLYPTNHILMGYADRMAWRNMVGYSGSLQLKPSIAQQLDFRFWLFRKANNRDCWYTANQSCFASDSSAGGVATSNSLYKEIDGVYTLFFQNNKVAWQIGASYLLAGQMLDQLASQNAAAHGAKAVDSIWAYTQLHVNF
jgi:hypothetical protein